MTGRSRGRLIALEGIDGSGKSTQARILADRLPAVLSFAPGATDLGRSLRSLLLDPSLPPAAERAEALLMAADRAQHVSELVLPVLEGGQWMVTDRFSGSTLAYQGYGRGMDLGDLGWLVGWATGGLRPDLNVLIDIPVDTALDRRAGHRPDRFEELGTGFQQRVAEGFRQIAADQPADWLVVDGAQSVDEVAEAVLSAVGKRLGSPSHG